MAARCCRPLRRRRRRRPSCGAGPRRCGASFAATRPPRSSWSASSPAPAGTAPPRPPPPPPPRRARGSLRPARAGPGRHGSGRHRRRPLHPPTPPAARTCWQTQQGAGPASTAGEGRHPSSGFQPPPPPPTSRAARICWRTRAITAGRRGGRGRRPRAVRAGGDRPAGRQPGTASRSPPRISRPSASSRPCTRTWCRRRTSCWTSPCSTGRQAPPARRLLGGGTPGTPPRATRTGPPTTTSSPRTTTHASTVSLAFCPALSGPCSFSLPPPLGPALTPPPHTPCGHRRLGRGPHGDRAVRHSDEARLGSLSNTPLAPPWHHALGTRRRHVVDWRACFLNDSC